MNPLSSYIEPTFKEGEVSDKKQKQELRRISGVSLCILIVGMLFVWTHMGWHSEAATALLWSLSSLIAGASIGFLFGIPKIIQRSLTDINNSTKESKNKEEYRQQVNTNLTEISDWLTKIIVGLGLANLSKIPSFINQVANIMAIGFNATSPISEKSFALSIIVGFPPFGFLLGYLYTRMYLAGAFFRADQRNSEMDKVVYDEARITELNPTLLNTEGLPTEGEVQAARRLDQEFDGNDILEIKGRLLSFAREYERVRVAASPGEERTRAMEVVLTKMRTMALAGYKLLPEFANSQSAGDRLVAIAMLQVKPDVNYFDWLAERLVSDRPFVGYHAAVAFRTAANVIDPPECPVLKRAIEKAIELLADQKQDTDRYKVLDQTLRSLTC